MESIQPYLKPNIWPLVNLMVVGFLIYLALHLGNRILLTSSGKNPALKRLAGRWSLIERSFWAFFLFLLLVALVKGNPIVGSVVAGLLVLSLWPFLRNFLSGLVLQYGGNYNLGKSILFNGIEGNITGMRAFTCELTLTSGTKDIMQIPYKQLTEARVTQTSPSASTVSSTVDLAVPKSMSALEAEMRIREILYNSAWLLQEDKHAIELLVEQESEFQFRVVFHGIDTTHLLRARDQLLNHQFS